MHHNDKYFPLSNLRTLFIHIIIKLYFKKEKDMISLWTKGYQSILKSENLRH
jgi:hypothetical protein